VCLCITPGEKYKKGSGFPGNLGLQGGSFVNAGVIPRVNGLKSPPIVTKDASPPSRSSLERDLGLGTSGEDESSESSLSKKNKKAGKGLNYPMKEFYNNEGYWSDDEENLQNNGGGHNGHPSGRSMSSNNKAGPSNQHQRNNSSSHPRNSNSLSHNSNSRGERVRSGSLPREPPSIDASAKRKSSRGSYINESKFP
jgi:hypothetical protein